ncbi:FISUMP domain-containing protein [Flavobacterium sp. LB2P53]|uniref:FISUMP domain-containing protein n=1 Tax=Flavobacterium sp. LB2P53 TaxID=2497481 RepID=UPI000F849A8F|nr:FISUMP domain-containing protein [Flavobacterium sp. LB2P53]RTY65832.1 hypothetical protein EKL95_12195 [Flavobacterium sp. LB2P53]
MKKSILILSLLIVLFYGCSSSNDDNSTTNVVPAAPTNLNGTFFSNTQVNLTWTDNSSNETGFKIERTTGDGIWSVIGTVKADMSTFSDVGLAFDLTYFYRVYSFNVIGNSVDYSNIGAFQTKNSLSSLTTKLVTEITNSTAVCGGNISLEGSSNITARGIVWSISQNPTIALTTKTTDGLGIGSYISNLTGLLPETTYYLKAYSTNSAGTSYGNEINFRTLAPELPVISTTAISNIASASAVSGGNITSSGRSGITASGVVWSTLHNPTIALTTKTIGTSYFGNFISNLYALSLNTTYYVRAYATNSFGTSYGDEQSFTTILYYTKGNGVIDVDGNAYPTIIINGKEWMHKNLNVSKYRNGNPIKNISEINTGSEGAWSYYNNDSANGNTYGKLYNWYAVADSRGLAPQGWHIASKQEWMDLRSFLGSADSAIKMKEAGRVHWLNNQLAYELNSSGFTALPAGNIFYLSAGFSNINYASFWWSSTISSSSSKIWYALIGSNDFMEMYEDGSRDGGNSVRCVKD